MKNVYVISNVIKKRTKKKERHVFLLVFHLFAWQVHVKIREKREKQREKTHYERERARERERKKIYTYEKEEFYIKEKRRRRVRTYSSSYCLDIGALIFTSMFQLPSCYLHDMITSIVSQNKKKNKCGFQVFSLSLSI